MARRKQSRGWSWRLNAWAALAVTACLWLGASERCLAGVAPSQPGAEAEGAAANNEKQVTVEAEGTGATKMEALQSAWMEAVRKGVGMFMASKTELVNDKLTEQIVTHSRGQVNAYQIVEERKGADGWHLKIKARIDKDILQETAEAATSQKVAFDGKDLAAQKVTQQEKQKSAEQVWKEIEPLLDFRKCLKYKFSVEKITFANDFKFILTGYKDTQYKKGDFVFGCHVLTWDLAKFEKQCKELSKLFDLVAKEKRDVQYITPNYNKIWLAALKRVSADSFRYGWKHWEQRPKFRQFFLEDEWQQDCNKTEPTFPWNNFDFLYDYVFMIRMKDEEDKNSVIVVKNTSSGYQYIFDQQLKSITPQYQLQFYVKSGDGLDSLELNSSILNELFIGADCGWYRQRIAPLFKTKAIDYPHRTVHCHTIICIQPLNDLTPEQLTNIKSLNAGYTLKRVTND